MKISWVMLCLTLGMGMNTAQADSIASWGYNNSGQVSNTPTENVFIAIAAGSTHSLALRADGSIISWGRDLDGVVSNTPQQSGFTAIVALRKIDNNLALLSE